MDASVLEQQRSLHEEVERVQDAIVRSLMQVPKTNKERVAQEHRISRFLARIQSQGKLLRDLYIDEDGARKKEMAAIAGGAELGEFYLRLKTIKDHHRRNPHALPDTLEAELSTIDQEQELEELDRLFTGEEMYGRHLDLNEAHTQYINLKSVDRVDYINYLDVVDQFERIPRAAKGIQYDRYLDTLVEYLSGFMGRSQPLMNVQQLKEETMQEFQAQRKDDAMQEDSIYCRACAKVFAKQSVYDAHLTGKKHLKAMERLRGRESNGTVDDEFQEDGDDQFVGKPQERAWKEFLIQKYLQLLHEAREETKSAAERKLTLTMDEYEKRAVEDAEEIAMESEEEESGDDEEAMANPLKLPLGRDGKPIPYWLYKTYGLGIEYPCEICGNFVYMGRQNFDRHFSEWRHAQGLRCLGIPNTKQFYEITLINDAIELWKKIQAEAAEEANKQETVEEFEDAQGNVFNKKTYEDLRRQGLL